MKKIIIILVALLFLLLPGCSKNESKQEVFVINYSVKTYEYTNKKGINCKRTEKLIIEKENERFKWVFETNDDERNQYFEFWYSDMTNGLERLKNSDEFSYETENGEKIIFVYDDAIETSVYKFTGSITIYISYSNACENIKNSINDCLNNLNNKEDYISINTFDSKWVFDNTMVNYITNEIIC